MTEMFICIIFGSIAHLGGYWWLPFDCLSCCIIHWQVNWGWGDVESPHPFAFYSQCYFSSLFSKRFEHLGDALFLLFHVRVNIEIKGCWSLVCWWPTQCACVHPPQCRCALWYDSRLLCRCRCWCPTRNSSSSDKTQHALHLYIAIWCTSDAPKERRRKRPRLLGQQVVALHRSLIGQQLIAQL